MSLKILRIGDPHAKVNNLDEMKKLILFVIEKAKEHEVNRIEILGDLFHTHAVLRLEVLDFWTWALDALSKTCETIVLVGNHDLSGDYGSNISALSVFGLMNKKNLFIIEKPTQMGVFAYVPYIHDPDTFIRVSQQCYDNGARILVCHQTLQGSKYESGIYAPDGIPTGEWSERFIHIISGHIHSEQSFGNILYPGTARWDSLVDANRRKGIWLYDHSDGSDVKRSVSSERHAADSMVNAGISQNEDGGKEGAIRSTTFISTENVCSPIKSIEWHEGDPEPDKWPENAKVAVELVGSSVWVAQQKEKFKGKCSIKTKITDKHNTQSRTTGGSLEHFLRDLFVSNVNKDELLQYAKEIGIV